MLASDPRQLLLFRIPRAYRSVPAAALLNAVNATLVAVVVATSVAIELMASWLAAVYAVSLVRVALWWRFRQAVLDSENVRLWALLHIVGAGAAGSLWGVAGLVFFVPTSIVLQVFVIFVIGGMGAGALAVSSHYIPGFYAFFLASVPWVLISTLSEQDTLHYVMAALVAVFIAAMILLGRYLDRTFKEIITLQLERAALLEQFRDFAEISSDWYWETGPDIRFTYLSGRVHDIFGMAPEDLLGKTPAACFDWEGAAEAWQSFMSIVDQRASFRDFVCQAKRPDGKGVDLTLSGKPIFAADGSFRGYRGTGREAAPAKALPDESLPLT